MKKNASDLAYKFIKARIVEQEYPQDSQLKEIAIAKELGVTRTPVREALIKLAGEGIVRIIHNRGAFVISLLGLGAFVVSLSGVSAGVLSLLCSVL